MPDGQLTTISTNTRTGQPAPVELVKLRDEPRTNTVAFANDEYMVYPIAAGETIVWRCVLFVGGNSPGDGKVQFATPAAPASGGLVYWAFVVGAVAAWTQVGGVAASYNAPLALLYAQGGAGFEYPNVFEGRLVNGVNPGQFCVQTAQNAANATPTVFFTGSSLTVWRYNP